MGARLRLDCGNGVVLEVTAETLKEAFKAVASYQEVFAERQCGQCGGERLSFEHRTDSENHDYYSIRCRECGAQLDMGQHKSGGTLFTKRKTSEGLWDKDHWYQWSAANERKSGNGENGGTQSSGKAKYEEPSGFGEF